jgi:UDP-3-O-[3-hydroxymyristoyl] glucosamine N-acyltransferase
VIGADGFGFAREGARYVKIPQVGRVVVEDDVEIGANVTIDRARFNKTHVGRGTKIDTSSRSHTTCGSATARSSARGVTIGENSIIGAGSVVVQDIPPNAIAAGNPAKVVKQLDPDRKITTRAEWFADPARLYEEIDEIDRDKLGGNTFLDWIRSSLFPAKGD